MNYAPLAIALTLTYPAFAYAKEAAPLATVQKEDIRLLGRLNVNLATRDELLAIPALDEQRVDQLLEARTRGPLTSLVCFALPDEALARLSTSGPSTLRRIRPLPLEVLTSDARSATR